jgi:hypothetical protein
MIPRIYREARIFHDLLAQAAIAQRYRVTLPALMHEVQT